MNTFNMLINWIWASSDIAGNQGGKFQRDRTYAWLLRNGPKKLYNVDIYITGVVQYDRIEE